MATLARERGMKRTEGVHSLPSLQLGAAAAHARGWAAPEASFRTSASKLLHGASCTASGFALPRLAGASAGAAASTASSSFAAATAVAAAALVVPPAVVGPHQMPVWAATSALLRSHSSKLPLLRLEESPLLLSQKLCEEEERQRSEERRRRALARNRNFGFPTGEAGSTAGTTVMYSMTGMSSASGEVTRLHRPAIAKPNKYRKLTAADRRHASQAALAADQQFVMENLMRAVEQPTDFSEKQEELDQHRWKNLFAPVEEPKRWLPKYFNGRFPPLSVEPWRPRPATVRDLPTLAPEELEELVNVCVLFAQAGELGPPSPGMVQHVLTRPSFCRLICAMSGLSIANGERTWLSKAAELFDSLATKHPNNSAPGGYVTGLSLFAVPKSKLPELAGILPALPAVKLFVRLLVFMMDEVKDLGVQEAEERLLKESDAKRRLFDVLLPQAEAYAAGRAAYVRRRIEDGRSHLLSPCGGSDNEPGAAAAPAPAAPATPAGHKDVSARRRKAARRGDDSSDSDREGSPLASKSVPDSESEAEATRAARQALYAHTFGVMKGELLMSQLLEPEIVHFVAEFSDLFRIIFQAYCDVPKSDCEGHMSLRAFLRVCDDFGLFPAVADFKTVQWLYETAEGCTDLEPPVEAAMTSRRTKSGRGWRSEGHSATGTSSTRSFRDFRKKEVKRKGSMGGPHEGFLFYGKWLRKHLAWLTKDFAEMSDDEARASAVLWVITEWMEIHRQTVKELFVFLDRDSSGTVSVDELQAGVDFMRFEDPPSHEDVRTVMKLLMTPAALSAAVEEGKPLEVEFVVLQMALTAVCKQRENRDRAANCFLKEYSKMTRAESNAAVFFRALLDIMESRRMSPEQLFDDVDDNRNGTISTEELTRHAHMMMKLQVKPNPALGIQSPLELLDTNQDGKVTRAEFVDILDKVIEARKVQAQVEEVKHPIFLCSSVSQGTPDAQRIFGRRAFTETLLKVALVHLGYHGTTAQAEQPSFVKAMWLLVYMNWQYSRACARAAAAAAAAEAVEDPFPPHQAIRHLPKCLTPLQRLLKYHPRLFENAPERPSPLQPPPPSRSMSRAAMSRPGTSDGLFRGWGRLADAALAACLAGCEGGVPAAHGESSLDRLLLAAAVGST